MKFLRGLELCLKLDEEKLENKILVFNQRKIYILNLIIN